jgi:hydroxymethylbilane synthase
VESLRIATRNSPLAMWQAENVKARLESLHPGLQVELIGFTTRGDKILDTPLARIGGKGLFVKELEQAMLDGRADIAVHSMKDVPMEFPEGLELGVICEREDPRDALVAATISSIDDLPEGCRVGTSSLRRQSQLLHRRPDLEVISLRGNVQTRLKKLDQGDYDAIILAAAGLIRLGLEDRIQQAIPDSWLLPAAGQGAMGIELRADDNKVVELLQPLEHRETSLCVRAERAMNRHLQGGCQVPIAGFAEIENEQISMRGLVGSLNGETLYTAAHSGSGDDPETIGINVAKDLLQQGADKVLAELEMHSGDSPT